MAMIRLPKVRKGSPAFLAPRHIQSAVPRSTPVVAAQIKNGNNLHVSGTITSVEQARALKDIMGGKTELIHIPSKMTAESVARRGRART